MDTAFVESLGARVAALRRLNGLSLEQLARLSGLTKSYLSKVERGLSAPSIASMLKLARALGVGSGQLLGQSVEEEDIAVVRAAERVPFSRDKGRAGYAYEAIAAHRPNKAMTPFVMRPPFRRGKSVDLVTHAGEEMVFVIAGEMEIVFRDQVVALKAGDSVYFNAGIPHRARSVGDVLAEALVVVSDPKAT
jgi:transcriptional regulator with XRE-family HTH domain